jgi:hypothetical protein
VPPRGLAAATAGWIAPDQVISGNSAVTTEFTGPATLVAIELGGGAAAGDVALGLDGARRPAGPDGRELPPAVVADGPRTVLVYEVLPETAAKSRLAVTVVTAASRRLAGVAATLGNAAGGAAGSGAAEFAASVAARGLGSLVGSAATDGLARSHVFWKGA